MTAVGSDCRVLLAQDTDFIVSITTINIILTFSRHSHQVNPTTPQISRKLLNFLARKMTKLKVQFGVLRAINTYTSSQQKLKEWNINENKVPNNPEEVGGADSELQFSGHFLSVEGFSFF